MPIFNGSRYQGISIQPIRMNGTVKPYIESRVALGPEVGITQSDIYEVKDGDKLDAIAWRFRGKPELWWIIAEANEIEFCFDIKAGQKLIIPPQEIFNKYG